MILSLELMGVKNAASPTERMRITDGGDVGIGTDTPSDPANSGKYIGYQLVLSPQTNTLVMVLI